MIPSIAIGPPDDAAALREALTPARLAGVDWVVFTSANGVEHTWRALAEAGRGREVFAAARFAVVGAATREALEAHGASADVVAKEFRGEGVARALLDAIGETSAARPARVLLLRAQEASDIVPQALLAAGVEVDVVAAYRTRPSPEGAAEICRLLLGGLLDVVVFSSGSTVDAVCDALGAAAATELARVTVACIGPVTAAAASARGVRVDVVPAVATFPAVIEALEARFRAI